MCIFFTVSCRTIMEEEKKEEISLEMATGEILDLDALSDSLISRIDSIMAEILKKCRH